MDEPEKNVKASAPLTIDIVSDAVCPWCFVGKRKLEAALATLDDLAVDLHWRPFQLDPTIPRGGIDRQQYLLKKFGPERVGKIGEHVTQVGAELGIDFAFDKIKRSPNTLDAHRLIRWARNEGRQTEVVERLFELYFLEGGDIGDRGLLSEVASQFGLDGDLIRRRLETDTDISAVEAEIAGAARIGVTGVPFFIFAGSFGVPGAQSPDVLVAAIREAQNPPPRRQTA